MRDCNMFQYSALAYTQVVITQGSSLIGGRPRVSLRSGLPGGDKANKKTK